MALKRDKRKRNKDKGRKVKERRGGKEKVDEGKGKI